MRLRLMKTLLLVGWFSYLTCPSHAQEFILENPLDPGAASAAVFQGTDLVITDSAGQRFTYLRRPELDTPDRLFVGYFSPAANQYLRWPTIGAGSMQVGRPVGGAFAWTLSKMQLRRIGGGIGPVGGYAPGSPMHVDVLSIGANAVCAAQIDSTGRLHFYLGHGGRWKHFTSDHASGVLLPGAPLHLVPDSFSPVPRVISIGSGGRFVEIVAGKGVSEIKSPPGTAFIPGSHFSTAQTKLGVSAFATDQKGRLWQIQLTGGPHVNIEPNPAVLEAGLPITSMEGGQELFMIDRKGAIVVYSQDGMGQWFGPEYVDDEFVSAGHLSVWSHPGTLTREIAAVDSLGRLQVLHPHEGGWTKSTIPGVKLPPGAPLTGFETSAGINLSSVLPDGQWVEFFEFQGNWNQRVLAPGFPSHAPLASSKLGPMLFATDITGRLVSSLWDGNEWRTSLCVPGDFSGPGYLDTPQLVSRRLVSSAPINPATIQLVNTTQEEMVVRIRDSRIPGKVEEIALKPGGTSPFVADRDAGGTLEEVYIVPGPAGPIQQVRQIPLPPRQFFDVIVYANRVTYQYIDKRKQRGPLPDFNETSQVSVGSFPLPAGNLLADGTQLDVFQIASSNRNPGAAAIQDPQLPNP